MKWRGDQIKNANLSPPPLLLSLSASLSQAAVGSQHSHLRVLGGGELRPLGSLAPWLDNSFPAWRGQRWAVWETGSHWGSRGDVFQEEWGEVSGGWLAWSEHWQFPNSVVPARARWALTHYATHRKRPEALEAWRYKAPDRSVRKR